MVQHVDHSARASFAEISSGISNTYEASDHLQYLINCDKAFGREAREKDDGAHRTVSMYEGVKSL